LFRVIWFYLAETLGGYSNNAQYHPASQCLAAIYVEARISVNKPRTDNLGGFGDGVNITNAKDWETNGDKLVSHLLVNVQDTPLAYSASEITRDIVLNSSEKNEQEQLKSAKQNKPSL
jgi:hypothetical protein